MSLIFSCGFARVAVKESFHKAGRAQQETARFRDGKITVTCLSNATAKTEREIGTGMQRMD